MVIKNSEQYFYTCDNTALKNIKEMLEWMKNSTDESFSNHINSDKNDFTGWVLTILKDGVLSKKIDKLKDREEVVRAIENRLASMSKPKDKKKNIISQLKKAIMNG